MSNMRKRSYIYEPTRNSTNRNNDIFFTAVFLWIRYSKLRYNSSDIDSIKISFLKAGVCTTVSIGLVLYLGTNDKRMTILFVVITTLMVIGKTLSIDI